MSFIEFVPGHEVNDPTSFIRYAQQTLGCPYPTGKDIAITRKMIKEFFNQYPDLDYQALVRTVDWCASKRKRFSRVYKVIAEYRFAYKAGVVGDLIDRSGENKELEAGIAEALEVEQDRGWRAQLIGSRGPGRRVTFEAWVEKRRPQLVEA